MENCTSWFEITWRFAQSVYSYTRWKIFKEWNNNFRCSNRSVELNSSGLNQIWYFVCLLSCPYFFPLSFPLWLICFSLMTLWTLCVSESTTGQGFWTSQGMRTFTLERNLNLCMREESSSASHGKGQVHAQQHQGMDAASAACSAVCHLSPPCAFSPVTVGVSNQL